jgi:predicted acetyltransferase
MASPLTISVPKSKFAASYVAALREGFRSIQPSPKTINWIENHFTAFLEQEADISNRPEWWQSATSPITLDDGSVVQRVPCTTLWLLRDENFIGEVAIRHRLTPELQQIGGHIGYNVRQSERRYGYGTQLLQIGLNEARRLCLEKVLITCNDDNIGSIKIIEAAGAQLEQTIAIPGRSTPQRHYWIHTSQPPK